MPSNIYSRAILRQSRGGDRFSGGNLAAEARMMLDQDAINQEKSSKDAWQQNYQQQQLGLRNQQLDLAQGAADLQNAKRQLDLTTEQHKIDTTNKQIQAAPLVYKALANLDPTDINFNTKLGLVKGNPDFSAAFAESNNGIEKGINDFISRKEAEHAVALKNGMDAAKLLGVDPLYPGTYDEQGNYKGGAHIDPKTGRFDIGAMQQTAATNAAKLGLIPTADKSGVIEYKPNFNAQQAALAQKSGLLPIKINGNSIDYSDSNGIIATRLKSKYGIDAPIATVLSAQPNNPDIIGGVSGPNGDFGQDPQGNVTHYQIANPNGKPAIVSKVNLDAARAEFRPMVGMSPDGRFQKGQSYTDKNGIIATFNGMDDSGKPIMTPVQKTVATP